MTLGSEKDLTDSIDLNMNVIVDRWVKLPKTRRIISVEPNERSICYDCYVYRSSKPAATYKYCNNEVHGNNNNSIYNNSSNRTA